MEKLSRLLWLLLFVVGGIICLPLIIIAIVCEAFTEPTENYYHRY